VKLAPCPFCGEEAEIERYGNRRVSTIYRCTFCGCSLETGEEWDHGAQWNERVTLPRKDQRSIWKRIDDFILGIP
jgi:hypothetical protein